MKLVYENSLKSGKPRLVNPGDRVTTFRGDKGTVSSIERPHHSGSTGRVYVKQGKNISSYFPSVIGAVWIEREDQV